MRTTNVPLPTNMPLPKRALLRATWVAGLIATLALTFPGAARANHALAPLTVRAIQADAASLRKDAGIYQRRRTQTEVGLLIVDVRTLQTALLPHACLKAQSEALGQAMTDLRAARTANDVRRLDASITRLLAVTDGLLQKDCGVGNKQCPMEHPTAG